MLDFIAHNWNYILPTAVQFLGILLGAWIVGRQIAAQGALQDAQTRDKLFADLYDRVSDEIDLCQDTICRFQSVLSSCPGKIGQYWWLKDQGVKSSIPYRSEDLSRDQHELLMSILKITSTLERYEITFPDQRLLASAKGLMLLQSEQLSEDFRRFWDFTHRFLPIDIPEDEPARKSQSAIIPPRPTEEDLKAMDDLAARYINECAIALGYLIDLRHEFQNNLLGHLFKRTLTARVPNKPDLLVIKNDEDMLSKIESRLKERQDEIRDRVKVWRESS